MAIDPLQSYPATPLAEKPQKRSSDATSGFETILGSKLRAGKESGAQLRQSAADLLRVEMMLTSLALSGDAETAEPFSPHTLLGSLGHGALWLRPPESGCRDPEALERLREMSPDAADVAGIEATAAEYLGAPYRFGGEGKDGIDCSGFVQRVFHEHRVELPRTAREQIQVGRDVAEGDLKKGDLVFFQTYAGYPSHVGIYLGGGKMIHASSEKGEVTVSDMNSAYYRSRYLGAKRVA